MRIICLASLLFVAICWAAKEEVNEFGDNECQSKGSDLHESVARDSDNICGVDSESIASAKSKNKAGKNDQKVDRITSLQKLFKWLKRMKNITSDFNVFEKVQCYKTFFRRKSELTQNLEFEKQFV